MNKTGNVLLQWLNNSQPIACIEKAGLLLIALERLVLAICKIIKIR